MSERLDRIATIAVVVACVAVVASISRQALAARETAAVAEVHTNRPPEFVENWKSVYADGLRLDPDGRPVQLAVFSDLECPYCALFHLQVLPRLEKEFPGQIATTFMHLPIPSHRFAIPSAIALECAASQGRAREFLDHVYMGQDSIGLRSWANYAEAAKVAGIEDFNACIKREAPSRITAGRDWANKLEVNATPTIIVNGWQFVSTPSESTLIRVIEALLEGRSPQDVIDG